MSSFNIIPHSSITNDADKHFPKGFENASNGTTPMKVNSTTLLWVSNPLVYNKSITLSGGNFSQLLLMSDIFSATPLYNGEFSTFESIFQFKAEISSITNYFQISVSGFYTFNGSQFLLGDNYSVIYNGSNSVYYLLSDLELDLTDTSNPKLKFNSSATSISCNQIVNIMRKTL
jgi:hypothetical protein